MDEEKKKEAQLPRAHRATSSDRTAGAAAGVGVAVGAVAGDGALLSP